MSLLAPALSDSESFVDTVESIIAFALSLENESKTSAVGSMACTRRAE